MLKVVGKKSFSKNIVVWQCGKIAVRSDCHTHDQKGVDLTSECGKCGSVANFRVWQCGSVADFSKMSVAVWQCGSVAKSL